MRFLVVISKERMANDGFAPGRGIFSSLSAVENLEIVRRRSGAGTVDEVFTRFPKLAELRDRPG